MTSGPTELAKAVPSSSQLPSTVLPGEALCLVTSCETTREGEVVVVVMVMADEYTNGRNSCPGSIPVEFAFLKSSCLDGCDFRVESGKYTVYLLRQSGKTGDVSLDLFVQLRFHLARRCWYETKLPYKSFSSRNAIVINTTYEYVWPLQLKYTWMRRFVAHQLGEPVRSVLRSLLTNH